MATVVAEEGVRPIASQMFRFATTMGLGGATAVGVAIAADNKFDRMPSKNDPHSGYIDRVEARNMFSGPDSVLNPLSFLALVPLTVLYSAVKKNVTPTELKILRHGYAYLGGMLLATNTVAPAILPDLPRQSTS